MPTWGPPALYKRLSSRRTTAQIDRLQTETEDRWGHLPLPVRNLFDLSRLRLAAEAAFASRAWISRNANPAAIQTTRRPYNHRAPDRLVPAGAAP